jgi:hypothetical protein
MAKSHRGKLDGEAEEVCRGRSFEARPKISVEPIAENKEDASVRASRMRERAGNLIQRSRPSPKIKPKITRIAIAKVDFGNLPKRIEPS